MLTPVSRYWAKLRRGISNFRISGQSLCHNFRTSDDTDMKLGPVTTLDKTTSKKIDVDAMSENDDVIAISSQFGAIRIPDSGHIVCNLFSLIVTFYLTKQNWKVFNTALTLLLWVNILFRPKIAESFLQKDGGISKIKRTLVLKGIFTKTTYEPALTCQISSF